MAQWLDDLAAAPRTARSRPGSLAGAAAAAPAFRRVEEDVLIQRGLALFFAAKLRSAVLWRIYTQTGHRAAGEAAIARYTAGRDAWAAMAERAKCVYRPDISYGSNTRCAATGSIAFPPSTPTLPTCASGSRRSAAPPAKVDPTPPVNAR